MEKDKIVIGIIFFIVLLGLINLFLRKPKKSMMNKRMNEKFNENSFYPGYHLTQEQAEKDVDCEYKGFLTRYF
jgi:hypothetical protein